MTGEQRRSFHWLALVVAVAVICAALLLRFGGELLAPSLPLPPHAQVAVALNGSAAGVRARTSEAARLLQQGVVDHVIVSIPPTGYWGESIPPEANAYFARRFGAPVAARILYCVSSADSTIQEARALMQCLDARDWRSAIIVTSNYHVRRARRIWQSAAAKVDPPLALYFEGVADGSFQPRGWWRKRIYAKTWLLETSKLVWESIFGQGPWKSSAPTGKLTSPPAQGAAKPPSP